MKRLLPVLKSCLLPVMLLAVAAVFLFVLPKNQHVSAADTPDASAAAPAVVPAADGSWAPDPEVTFVGKNAARSGYLLNWSLANYDWVCVSGSGDHCDNTGNPLLAFWYRILGIVGAMLLIFVLVTAFVIIITRGRSITAMKFVPRFIAIVLLIAFSFAILQFLYQLGDIVQGFFLHKADGTIISNADLLYVGWSYTSFEGLRRVGPDFAESAFISLLLVKLTALTYYVMVGVLIVRKIILWFFIIISPVFPLLLLFYPVRNTAKIWVGEFFRWLLYAPLFAIFLGGLVSLWQQKIPLNFSNPNIGLADTTKSVIYPTAINILLGGPKQVVAYTNSVNLTETFALYVVSLIMLWVVILLPFILLQIFLDYLMAFSMSESTLMKQIVSRVTNRPPSGSVTPTPPLTPAGAGIGRAIPVSRKFAIPSMESIRSQMSTQRNTNITTSTPVFKSSQVNTDVLKQANLSVPTMRDIARFETTILSKSSTHREEITHMQETLKMIASPASISTVQDREKFNEIREKLVEQSKSGNVVAQSVLNAVNTVAATATTMLVQNTEQVGQVLQQLANPLVVVNPVEKNEYTTLREQIVKASAEGDQTASRLLSSTDTIARSDVKAETTKTQIEKIKEELTQAKAKGDPIAKVVLDFLNKKVTRTQAAGGPALPAVNRVQQVSLDDYEAVKKMWLDNYQKMDVPQSADGVSRDRKAWIKNDVENIGHIIELLTSPDADKMKEGMESVSNILPFLLIGGFSQTEIVAYLKAKLEAGKSVLENIVEKDTEEESLLDVNKKHTEAEKAMTMTAAEPPDEEKPVQDATQEISDDKKGFNQ